MPEYDCAPSSVLSMPPEFAWEQVELFGFRVCFSLDAVVELVGGDGKTGGKGAPAVVDADVTPWDGETPNVIVPPGSGDTYREKWPEFADRIVEAGYLRLTAAGGEVTVGMAGSALAVLDRTTLATSVGADALAGMFEGCSNLSKARVMFTNWVDGATADWLKDVSERGDFICVSQLALPASLGGSTIPLGWTAFGPQVRLVDVRPVLRQLGRFTVKYELSGLYPNDAYRLVQKYTVRGQERSVTTELGHPTNGVYTVTNDVRTLYGELVIAPAAHLKVSLFGKSGE